MFCDEGGGAKPVLEALVAEPSGPWAVLIGPEGGFDPSERERLLGLGFVTPVSLGPRILRADTAAIAALSLWQAVAGDWRAEA
jgi:16S rRNA (uracil1498-N3)-methyltransferase